MHEFVEAFRFILHDGAIAGEPQLPSLLHLALETLKVGALGVVISVLIAVPVGVWLGHVHRGSFLAINVGNVGRALPSLAVLAIGDAFLGLGLGVVELVSLPFGGLGLAPGILLGLFVVIAALAIVAAIGRRRRDRAKAAAESQ